MLHLQPKLEGIEELPVAVRSQTCRGNECAIGIDVECNRCQWHGRRTAQDRYTTCWIVDAALRTSADQPGLFLSNALIVGKHDRYGATGDVAYRSGWM